MRNLFVMLAALSVLMLGGCLNSEMHEESGLLFVRSSSLFEPSATVVLQKKDSPWVNVPFAAGATGFEQVTGLGAPIGAAAVRRPNRTRVSAVGGDSSAGALGVGIGIGIGEGGDGGNGGGGGDGGDGGSGGNGHAGGHGDGENPGHDHGDDDD